MSTELTHNSVFEGHPVRIVMREERPWFVLKDVCDALQIGNPSDVARRLDSDEKADVILPGRPDLNSDEVSSAPDLDFVEGKELDLDFVEGNVRRPRRRYVLVSESGLYGLVLSSHKPAAKRFSKWVRSDVLPTIARTGTYGAAGRPQAHLDAADPFEALTDELLSVEPPTAHLPAMPPFRASRPFEAAPDTRAVASHYAWQLSDDAYRQQHMKLMIFMELVWETQPDADAGAIGRFVVNHPHLLEHPAIYARANLRLYRLK